MPIVGIPALTTLGALIADEARATVLVELMDGRARTAGELAASAGVAASTMSGHLTRLRDAGIVEVAAQGRHRYYRLAGDEIAGMLEHIGGLELRTPHDGVLLGRAEPGLRFARTCYDHLAGRLGVDLHDSLVRAGHVSRDAAGLRLTDRGRRLMDTLEVDVPVTARPGPVLRPCLDWTERRDHLGGVVAVGLFGALVQRGWLARGSRPRSVRVTRDGRAALPDLLGLDLSQDPIAPRRA